MTKPLRVLLQGFHGKMGSQIRETAIEMNDGLSIFPFDDSAVSANETFSFAIDFSLPRGTEAILEHCLHTKMPLVVGTTGLEDDHFKALKKASEIIPVFYSANMSVGVAILRRALLGLGKTQGYDFFIEEYHHKAKVDSPSGTAISILDAMSSGANSGPEIPVFSYRGGGIIGEHRAHLVNSGEHLIFSHKALSRSIFARGAIQAGLWLKEQKPGYYKMEDYLDQR